MSALLYLLMFVDTLCTYTAVVSFLHAAAFLSAWSLIKTVQVQEYFIALVDGTIEASVKYVREYVHAYLSDMLEEARGQIHSYGQSFTATMQAALTTSQQGQSLACLSPATCMS